MALGFDPNEDELILSTEADFVCSLTEKDTVWPSGTTCVLKFPAHPEVGPFEASIDTTGGVGSTASFAVPAAEVDPVPANAQYWITLRTLNSYRWWTGRVVRR